LEDRFSAQLKRQLGFIGRSAQLFDNGFPDEAIRIAVSIRVLMHQTKNSTSLLTHMGVENIKVASTYHPLGPATNPSSLFGFGQIALEEGKAQFIPHGGSAAVKAYIPSSSWWEEAVLTLSEHDSITRKDIVLGAANKDGGAHVELKLIPFYEHLARDGGLGVNVWEDRQGELLIEKVEYGHLWCLRTMAYELLASSDLLNLVEVIQGGRGRRLGSTK